MEKWKVIIVDDEHEIADYFADLVRNLLGDEIDLEVFYSGTRALEKIKVQPPALLITDVIMPITDGFKILEYVAGECKNTEVILLTAYEKFDYIYKANKIKACSYVIKAEDEDTIKRIIAEAAERVRDIRKKIKTIENAERKIKEVNQIFEDEKVRNIYAYDVENDKRIIESIKEYIKANAGEDLTVASIASVFHYSSAYLSKIYKDYSGEKLSSYIMRQKLSTAKKMLLETDNSIHVIAMALGYQSSQAFGRAFRRELSMTPQEFRRVYIGLQHTIPPNTSDNESKT